MAEGPTPGASGRLFGGNGLQRTADTLDRTMQRLNTAVSRAAPVFETIGRMGSGFRAGQRWSAGGSVGNNGGGASFSGQPPGGAGGTGGGTGGAPPTPGGQAQRGNWPIQARGNGAASTVGFAAGTAFSVGSQIAANFGQKQSDAATDMALMQAVTQQFRYGTKRSVPYKDVWTQGMQGNAQSGIDVAQAGSVVSRTSGGNANVNVGRFQQGMAFAGSVTFGDPTVSLAQGAAMVSQMHTATGWNQMRRVGIRTFEGGKKQSPIQMAQQILGKVGLGTKVLTPEQIAYVIDESTSATNQTLSNWVANGLISADQMEMVKGQMRMILTARTKGVSSQKLDTLMKQRSAGGEAGDAATKQLQEMGLYTQAHADKDLAGAQRQANVQRMEGWETSLADSTEALTAFQNKLNEITESTGLANLLGTAMGFKQRSVLAGVLGWLGVGNGGGGTNPGVSTGGGAVSSSFANGVAGGGQVAGSAGGGAVAVAGFGGFSEAATVAGALGGSAGGSSGMVSAAGGTTDTSTATGGGTGGTTAAPVLPDGDYSNMFGGVKPWVARAGVEIRDKFGVTDIGGVGHRPSNPTSDHPKGLALDFMVGNDKSKGDQIANYAVANRKRLGITYVIWYKKIFGSSGSWQDYGHPSGATDATSLHMDHVHCSFVTKDPGMGATNSTSGTGTSGAEGAKSIDDYNPSGGVEQWRSTVVAAMGAAGVSASKDNVDRTLMQMRTESSGNPRALNDWDSNWDKGTPSVGLMQVIGPTFESHAGPYKNTPPKNYGTSMDPLANIYASLKYAISKYGSLENAYQGHGYAKGAWKIKEDETARVHKGEMIIPPQEADSIRDVLTNANPYGTKGSARGGGVTIDFKPGSIVVHAGGGVSKGAGRALGKDIADAIAQDRRIRALQEGVYAHGG